MKIYPKIPKKYNFFVDPDCYVEENRKLACEFKKKHNFYDLRLRKFFCAVGEFEEGNIVRFQQDPEEFLAKLEQLYKDFG